MMEEIQTHPHPRVRILDALRGLTLLSMIAYHGSWDLVYLFGVRWDWYNSFGGFIWQQSICWTFILLSGFCWSMGRKRLKRGLTVLIASVLVTVVTLLFMYADRVVFGVLTLLGISMLLLIPMEKALRHVPAWTGLVLNAALFALTRTVNQGYLNLFGLSRVPLPHGLYQGGLVSALLGFTPAGFFSTDYFSLFPWLFLFLCGYFLYRLLERFLPVLEKCPRIPPLEFLGRHSLLLYLLHQPALYAVLTAVFYFNSL